ncbi:MAG: Fe-S cluster assembly protein SufD [Bacteroidetes bacterium]|nr:MAG: Fe-S cluster assembly protein SufD [Bacteroidota bacterium]
MNPTLIHKDTEFFLKEFEKFKGPGNGVLSGIRRDAIDQFSILGFPTTKHEEWKYTNVAPIVKNNFQTASNALSLKEEDIRPFLLTGKDSIRLVFENGRFNQALSVIPDLAKGVIIGNLAAHCENPLAKEHLAKHASYNQASFIALNTAFVNEGAFISIPESIVLEQTIHLIYVHDTRNAPVIMYPRNLIIAGKHSKVKIAETYHSIGEIHPGLTNSVTEIVVGENSSVEFDKIQHEHSSSNHISHTEAVQAKNSVFSICTVTLGGNVVRNNLHIQLMGENCETHLNGLYITQDKQLVDNHTLVDHAKPNCVSNELYKGIMDDHSQGVFNGKVLVRQDAQKTNAYQSNKNILLSDDASINTKPQLEIFADDVKCSHGATTGKLDEEALFYLRSRGIGEQKAKAFLNIAFAADVINKIGIESLRDRLMQLIELRLNKTEN